MKRNIVENIAVIIPSYKEEKNIFTLIDAISEAVPDSKIIVVDDSPKEYIGKIKFLLKKKKNIEIIFRYKKLGRGSAVLHGFNEAFKDKRIKYFFEIDSDLAHNPNEISRFIDKMEKGRHDVVIGSRYVKGGKI